MTVPVVNNTSVRANDALHFTTRPLVLLLLLRILLLLLHLNLSLPPLLKQQSPNSTLRFEKARGAHLFLEGGILRWLTLCVALSHDDDITFIADVIDDALAREIIRSKDTIFDVWRSFFLFSTQRDSRYVKLPKFVRGCLTTSQHTPSFHHSSFMSGKRKLVVLFGANGYVGRAIAK